MQDTGEPGLANQTIYLDLNNVATSITVPLTLPPATPFPAQRSANADYVEGLYRSLLQRNADPAGLSFWTAQLDNGAATRLQVAQSLRTSAEHFTDEVDAYYTTLLGRTADAAGKAYWVGQLQAGLREEQIAFAFLNSAEYLSKGDRYFVDSMYQTLLGRAFDPSGESYWLAQLGDDANGNPIQPATVTHARVVNGFLYSNESLQRLVQGYYQVYLQRPADAAGLNGWVGQLQQALPFVSIGQGFLVSDEFFAKAAANG